MRSFHQLVEAAEEWSRFVRQQQFPFMSDHDNPYYRRAEPFLQQEPEYGDDHDNWAYQPGTMYHVTTNLRGVMRDQRLKSRSELGGSVGLGGGWNNEAPDMVSLTYNYSRAREIYDQFKYVIDICHGRISASQIFQYFVDTTDDELSAVELVSTQYGVKKKWLRDGLDDKINATLDQQIVTPEDRYEFFQQLEQAKINDEMPDDYTDTLYQQSFIGFTGSFQQMARLNMNDLAIIQCVVRKNAAVSHNPHEAELRVRPEDVAIVRFLR